MASWCVDCHSAEQLAASEKNKHAYFLKKKDEQQQQKKKEQIPSRGRSESILECSLIFPLFSSLPKDSSTLGF
jgi:hypothetical protein